MNEQSQFDVARLMNDLKERQKESACLYKISAILNESSGSIENILLKIVEALPNGYQFPEICKAQIIYKGNVIQSENFPLTQLKQSTVIKFENSVIGQVNVYYVKPVKSENNRIFLVEEQMLLNEVAEKISHYITIQHLRELINDTNEISRKYDIPIQLSKWLSDWDLRENEINSILATRVDFKKNDLIFKQGVLASYLVVFTSGLAQAFVEDLSNRTYTFRLIKPFELIGLSSLFNSGHYGYTATAIKPSEGFLVSQDTIKSIMENNQKFNFKLIKWFSENLNFNYHKLNFLANKQSLGRIAETLIYLWKDIFAGRIIENSITRKIIAELSGMSTENAIRILSELKNDGIINVNKEGIEILKPGFLERFSIAG